MQCIVQSFLDKGSILIIKQSTFMGLLYNAMSLFAWYSSNLFFRDIALINEENVPKDGPTIVYGNHNNQFVDGVLLLDKIKRPIHFLAAGKSMRRPLVGRLLKAAEAIPVERPQDVGKQTGPGIITDLSGNLLKGHKTRFTKLTVGTQLFLEGLFELKVKKILSDSEMQVEGQNPEIKGQRIPYKFLLKLQFNQLYEDVWKSLKNNECIGIFPEGGSHDRMGLLPLKAGICIMAFGAMDKYGISVKIVPCGFHYYNPQSFRSKAIMQFGPAYQIPLELLELYRKDKKKAISILLQNLEKMLKAVTIEFDSYDELFGLYTARELYQLSSKRDITPKQKMELNRRFAKAYMLLRQNQKYQDVYQKLLAFSKKVQLSGTALRREDYFGSKFVDFLKFILYLQKCLLRSIIALPGVVMFGLTTQIIAYMAEKERIKSLKGSKVKMYGNDVVGSYKIILSTFLMPLTCAVHSVLLYFGLQKYTKLDPKTILKASIGLFVLQPIYALLFVKSYDSFKRSFQKLKFLFVRLFKKNVYEQFNKQKKEIQKKVLAIVEQEGKKVIENFEKNRILKKEELHVSESQLYIFDKEEMQQMAE